MKNRQHAVSFPFPMRGVDRRSAHEALSPGVTPDALNVLPITGADKRVRGGSRPGLSRVFDQKVGAGPVRLLENVTWLDDQSNDIWSEPFDSAVKTGWLPASTEYGKAGTVPSVAGGRAYADFLSGPIYQRGAIANPLGFDSTDHVILRMEIDPDWGTSNERQSYYNLLLRWWHGSPASTSDWYGIRVEFQVVNEDVGGYAPDGYVSTVAVYVPDGDKASEATYVGSVVHPFPTEPFWVTAELDGTQLVVTVAGTEVLSQALPAAVDNGMKGTGYGFTMEPVAYPDIGGNENADGVAYVNSFEMVKVDEEEAHITRMVMSVDGVVFVESREGELVAIQGGVLELLDGSGNLILLDDGDDFLLSGASVVGDRNLQAAERAQKLYVADYGDPSVRDEAGTIGSGDLGKVTVSGVDFTALGIDAASEALILSSGSVAGIDGTYRLETLANGYVTFTPDVAAAGTCRVRIERTPKIVDPKAMTVENWLSENDSDGVPKGQVPAGCKLIALYRDSLVLAAPDYAPHLWFKSRQGNPLDFDYGADENDVGRAVAGAASDAGLIGDRITALCPHSDDYLVIGCRQSLWVMRGDPAAGGQIDNLSRVIGVVDGNAWCHGPNGELYFVSQEGLMVLPPGAVSYPSTLSRERLPDSLASINPRETNISMAYDVTRSGVLITLTPKYAGTVAEHWWFDVSTQGFWPIEFPAKYQPTLVHRRSNYIFRYPVVMLGGYDGVIRYMSDDATTDDGQVFDSHVVLGPQYPGGGLIGEGILISMEAVLDESSGQVDWSVLHGRTVEEALAATPRRTGHWIGGANRTSRPMIRGSVIMVRLENRDVDTAWVLESLWGTVRSAGRGR